MRFNSRPRLSTPPFRVPPVKPEMKGDELIPAVRLTNKQTGTHRDPSRLRPGQGLPLASGGKGSPQLPTKSKSTVTTLRLPEPAE